MIECRLLLLCQIGGRLDGWLSVMQLLTARALNKVQYWLCDWYDVRSVVLTRRGNLEFDGRDA